MRRNPKRKADNGLTIVEIIDVLNLCLSRSPSPRPAPLGRGSRISNRTSMAGDLPSLSRRVMLLPLPKGPQNAKRSSPVGKLTRGGLGKPLGWDEGKGNSQPHHDCPTGWVLIPQKVAPLVRQKTGRILPVPPRNGHSGTERGSVTRSAPESRDALVPCPRARRHAVLRVTDPRSAENSVARRWCRQDALQTIRWPQVSSPVRQIHPQTNPFFK